MQKLSYPSARQDNIQDDYHGTLVPDPYRWLEDAASDETHEWGLAQSQLAARQLNALPDKAAMQESLVLLWDTPLANAPVKRGERLFYLFNDGLQNQAVLMLRQGLTGDERVLLDPNSFSRDGTVALETFSISRDGRWLAYSISDGGTDWQTITIIDVDRGEALPETLEWVRFPSIAWLPDASGFYYSRYPETDDRENAASTLNNTVYFHRLNTPQAEDRVIYARPDRPEFGFHMHFNHDASVLLLNVWHAAVNRNRLYYQRMGDDAGEVVRLIDEADAQYTPLDVIDDTLYLLTDRDAPRGRVVAVSLAAPDAWRTVIPESDAVIDSAVIANREIVVKRLHQATHQVHRYALDGSHIGDVPLPPLSQVSEMQGHADDDGLFLLTQSYLEAPAVLHIDLPTGKASPFFTSTPTLDRDAYVTRQVFYASKDGTQVSMFLTHRADLELNGENRTLLYGYGGFSIAVMPTYAAHVLNWVAQGGVYAVANLRGGSEYGEAWHQAGMLGNKQNVFDDFIAAGEWLIAQGYTRPGKLGIMGRSNGGLLVAAAMLQRPDLFGAVICNVPVTDMLRYHRFTAGRYWTAEYGNAEENADHFAFLIQYSPLHNVRPGTAYPPTLILSADLDDRVVPMHAKKFAAALQAAQSADAPILLRLDTRSGHGHGKPTAKWIEEWADIHAFLLYHLR